MFNTQIPPIELAWVRASINNKTQLKEIADLKFVMDNKERNHFNLSYSLLKPESTFDYVFINSMGVAETVKLRAVDIDKHYAGSFGVQDVHNAFKQAFRMIAEIFCTDAGFDINILRTTIAYELINRHLQYNRSVDVLKFGVGDINILFAEFDPPYRLANAYTQYTPNAIAPVMQRSNAGLTILFNAKAQFRLDDDRDLLRYPQGDNGVEQYRFSLLTVMVHELAHLFGVPHFPTSDLSIFPVSVMKGNIRAGIPFYNRFPDGLWQDYWLRSCLAKIYDYKIG